MDLNMIKGLGPAFRQTMYKNGVYHVEQLVKILPTRVVFHEPIDLNTITENSVVTVEINILSIDCPNGSEDYNVSANCNDIIITLLIKKHQILLKQLIPGSTFKIHGYFDIDKKHIEVYKVFSLKQKIFNGIYEVGDLPTSQIQNFSEKGLHILEEYYNELPLYIKEKLKIEFYKDILFNIHMPKSAIEFNNGLRKYTYEAAFNYFIRYYYYVLTTSLNRNEDKFDINKINTAIKDFEEVATIERKKILNDLLKEFTKPFYTNILVENCSVEEKNLVNIISIVTKVSMKKQVVVITNGKFDEYLNLKEQLLQYNIKLDAMARKGRNKENFSNFNTGKYDVLITNPINFDELVKDKIGLVIIDEDKFDIATRCNFNCANVDTIFHANTNFKNNIDKNIFKNLSQISFKESTESEILIVLNEIFKTINFDIIKEMFPVDEIKKIINVSSKDAYEFIKEKKFKENKENYLYLKKNMDILQINNIPQKK